MTHTKRLLILAAACVWTFTFAKAEPIVVDVPAGTIGCRLPPQLFPPYGNTFYTGVCKRLSGGPMNVNQSPEISTNSGLPNAVSPLQLYKGQLVVCGATGCWVINAKLVDTWEK